MPLEIGTLLEGLLTVAAEILRHLATFFPKMAVQRALVRVGSIALGAGVRLRLI